VASGSILAAARRPQTGRAWWSRSGLWSEETKVLGLPVIQHLPSMHRALGFIPRSAKKQQQKTKTKKGIHPDRAWPRYQDTGMLGLGSLQSLSLQLGWGLAGFQGAVPLPFPIEHLCSLWLWLKGLMRVGEERRQCWDLSAFSLFLHLHVSPWSGTVYS
jgi:hypothetical protein